MSWVGALGGLLHVFASYGAQTITAQHSGVTAAHASEAARRARGSRVEGQMLARAICITRVEDLPDRDHTKW